MVVEYIRYTVQDAMADRFRSSPRFAEFFEAVRPFFADIEEMKHYVVQLQGTPA